MAVKKTIIENFELEDGTEVYVQSGNLTDVSLSFDGRNQQYVHQLTAKEARILLNHLAIVLDDIERSRYDGQN